MFCSYPNPFELYYQIISDSARDMASEPPSIFNKTFNRVFQKHLVGKSIGTYLLFLTTIFVVTYLIYLFIVQASSRISQFWKPDIGGSNTVPHGSRYLNDFEELRPLGKGTSWISVLSYMYNSVMSYSQMYTMMFS